MEKEQNTMEEKNETQTQVAEVVLSPDDEMHLRLMMEASVFYGHSKSRTNPKMRPYILSTRSGMEVINLLKTMETLDSAKKAVEGAVKSGGVILFVGTSAAVKAVVKESAEKLGVPHVTERWLGGTLTNFKTISERIDHFRKLKEDKATGRIEKYTKKERTQLDKELKKLEQLLGGLEKLEALPSMVFVADSKENAIAAREARKMHIPVVALVNTDSDPDIADHVIPANDRSPKSVAFLMSYIEKAVEKAKATPITPVKKKGEEEK